MAWRLLSSVFIAGIVASSGCGGEAGRSPVSPSALAARPQIAAPAAGGLTAIRAGGTSTIDWACVTGANAYGPFSSAATSLCATTAIQQRITAAPVRSTAASAPASLTASVTGSTVVLLWTSSAGALSYVVEAGSASGLANLANFDTGSTATTLTATNVTTGTYYVRVRARSADGVGSPSAEAVATVGGGGCGIPGAPVGLTATSTGTTVTLAWAARTDGCAPSAYVIEAGSAAGLRDLATFSTGSSATIFTASGVGAGTYYVRVRAAAASGTSAPSNEAVVRVGQTPSLFPYVAEVGRVKVGSSISAVFSQQHAEHASLVWNYFARLFVGSIGARTEMYYTTDLDVYRSILATCPTTIIPGARQLTTCYDRGEGIYRWYIMPYIIPDFGTQQHELSHSFLYGTYTAAEQNVWLKEGTGMYWESGDFDGGGNLVVTRPIPYLTSNFRRWATAGRLVPLSRLTALTRDEFYSSEPTLVYSQAGMFIYYLERNYSGFLNDLIARLNSRVITNNQQVVDFVISRTGRSVEQLDAAYVPFSLSQ